MPFFRGRPDLLRDFRAGRREVLEAVYWAYVGRVEHIIRFGFYLTSKRRSVTGVPVSEIADLVQEVFARAFRESARLSYDGQRDYGPFLGTIARNVVNDWARRRNRHAVELPDDFDESAAIDGELPWAEETVMQLVEKYLQELPPELRRVHEERYVHGRSQNAAAVALGLTRQRIRTLEGKLRDGLNRALQRAKLELDGRSRSRRSG